MILLFISYLSSPTFAETIYLKDGTSIRGKVINDNKESVV
jgi:hypothetical protein